MLAIHTCLIAWGAYRHTPTIDEPSYLAAGVSHWHLGRFDLCKVSPPLVRLWAALPVVLSRPQTDWRRYREGPGIRVEFGVGLDFIAANGRKALWWFTVARWACIPFSWLGAWSCYRWSGGLYGPKAGRLALLLWCFSPNILGHAQLMTPDVGVTALCITTCYALWRWTADSSWARALGVGALLGLAILAKTNAVVLFAVLPVAWWLAWFRAAQTPGNAPLRNALQCTVAAILAVYVVNAGYGFAGTGTRLGMYKFVSTKLAGEGSVWSFGNRFIGTPLEFLPLPLPAPFVEGIDLQQRDFENPTGGLRTYLRGQWYDHGWWWYYLYAASVKVPVGAWILLVLAMIGKIRGIGPRRGCANELMVIVPGMLLFAIASAQTGFGGGLRYVLPAIPFGMVLASSVADVDFSSVILRATRAVALGWLLLSSLFIYPNSLAYFNELAGGPLNGHAHLLGGNIDWGEDLLYLEEWIENHPQARPINVAFWSFIPLSDFHMDWPMPPATLRGQGAGSSSMIPPNVTPGWYAVSVSYLRGDERPGPGSYSYFLQFEAVDTVGYSVKIFHLTADELTRVQTHLPESD